MTVRQIVTILYNVNKIVWNGAESLKSMRPFFP